MSLFVLRTDAASHGTVFAQRIAYAETHHRILVLGTLGQRTQELTHHHKGVTVIEVVTVNDAERLLDDVLTHQHGMIGAPGLYTTFWNLKSLGQVVDTLEAELARHMTFVFRKNLGAELLLEVLTDHPYYLTKTSLNGVIYRIIHDGLPVGSQTIQLLQSAIAASHSSSQ